MAGMESHDGKRKTFPQAFLQDKHGDNYNSTDEFVLINNTCSPCNGDLGEGYVIKINRGHRVDRLIARLATSLTKPLADALVGSTAA